MGAKISACNARLDELFERAFVDAYDESEQRTALPAMLQEHLELPFKAQVLGFPVILEAIDLTQAEEIVAVVAVAEHGNEGGPARDGFPKPDYA